MGYARVPDWILEDDELMHYGILGSSGRFRKFKAICRRIIMGGLTNDQYLRQREAAVRNNS